MLAKAFFWELHENGFLMIYRICYLDVQDPFKRVILKIDSILRLFQIVKLGEIVKYEAKHLKVTGSYKLD